MGIISITIYSLLDEFSFTFCYFPLVGFLAAEPLPFAVDSELFAALLAVPFLFAPFLAEQCSISQEEILGASSSWDLELT